jgi:hypothetical protein
MRRIYCLAAVAIIASVSACQNEEEHLNVTDMFDRTYHATFENDVPVRTALGADNDVLWSEGDQISVFVNPENLPYLLTDGAGTSRGEFNVNAVSEGDPSQMFSATASFYPYDSGVTVIENDGSFTFNATFPAIQTFSASGTFGNGASPMVAVTSGPQDTDLSFKNVGAIFRLQLTGDAVITRIDFAANANLAGACTIAASADELPAVNITEGSGIITLDCGDGVQLSSTPTDFIVAMLPVKDLQGGIVISVYDNEGKKMVYVHKRDEIITIERSKAYSTEVLTYTGFQADPATAFVTSLDGLLAALDDSEINAIVLAAGLDLSDAEWIPIGTAEEPFTGTFDGNGKTISGLKISSGDYAGFFGYVSDAAIRNIILEDVNMSGGQRMGGLAGTIVGDAVVENCTVSGVVTGSDSNTGGLIGEIVNGTVQLTALMNSAAVTNTKASNSRAGGIVGQVTTNANVTITDCVNIGTVTTNNGYAGGIVSAYQSGRLNIDNCMNSGELVGNYRGNMLGWYTSVRRMTISTSDNQFDINAIGCLDISLSSYMSLYGKTYFVNRKADLAGVSDVMQNFSTIFADGLIGTSPKALWDKLIAFYSHAAETNANFAGYPKTYWEMFNHPVGYSGPDWDSYFNSYNAIADESQKLTKEEFTSASWREYIVYLAPED